MLARRCYPFLIIAILLPSCASPKVNDSAGPTLGPYQDPWESRAALELPEDPIQRDQVRRAAQWLKDHLETVSMPGLSRPIHVVAWKDPSLHTLDQNHLAGWLVTDTFWAGHALTVTDPELAGRIFDDLRTVGWYGNGLHEVLFVGRERLLHKPAAEDWLHGESLGSYPISNDRQVDVRVLCFTWNEAFGAGHPSMFAEHAAYEALNHFWNGRDDEVLDLIERIIHRQDLSAEPDWIFWDPQREVLVDRVNYDEWVGLNEGTQGSIRSWPFKMSVLLYLLRVTGTDALYPDVTEGLIRRLVESQHPDGGVCHALMISPKGEAIPGVYRTGEATAALMLSLTVQQASSR